MAPLVQKFGGTSVGDIDRIFKAAEIACQAHDAGQSVVTVVSAMGQTTDQLISLAKSVNHEPPERELDMLISTGEQVSSSLMSMAIQSLGKKSRAFTGFQAGILTEPDHGQAQITSVNPAAIEQSLACGEIAVVAGFQGTTQKQEITTLGRGGSDTTAIALAAALDATRCDIYTDVDGVYTADPHLIANARKLPSISYEEMLGLSTAGAKVMNARSVELAKQAHVPVRVRSTFKPNDTGTLITHQYVCAHNSVCGIACSTNQISFTLSSSKANALSDTIAQLLAVMSQSGIYPDIMSLTTSENGDQYLAFSVERQFEQKVRAFIQSLAGELGKPTVAVRSDLVRISVVGFGLIANPQAIVTIFDCLRSEDIAVQMVTSTDMTVSALIEMSHGARAVKAIHDSLIGSTS
jgi:aspartate kinase